MLTAEIIWLTSMLILTMALVVVGVLSISQAHAFLLGLVRAIVGVAEITGTRESVDSAMVSLRLSPPRDDPGRVGDWLVLAKAGDARIEPTAQVVSPSGSRDNVFELKLDLVDPPQGKVDLHITILDVATLTQLAELDATLPAVPGPAFSARVSLLAESIRDAVGTKVPSILGKGREL